MSEPIVFLRLEEVERRLGRKKSWIYAKLPIRPVKQGRENYWPEHEIVAYQQRLMDARSPQQ